jgi:hypothetical protein
LFLPFITNNIEELWLNLSRRTPQLLEQITIDLLGLNRTEELKQTRENLKLQKEEAEKQKNNLSPRELRA